MSNPKNNPVTLELPAYLMDILAQWVRADAQCMRLDIKMDSYRDARHQCEETAQSLALGIVLNLPAFSAQGDLADAINDRDEAYNEYYAAFEAKPKQVSN